MLIGHVAWQLVDMDDVGVANSGLLSFDLHLCLLSLFLCLNVCLSLSVPLYLSLSSCMIVSVLPPVSLFPVARISTFCTSVSGVLDLHCSLLSSFSSLFYFYLCSHILYRSYPFAFLTASPCVDRFPFSCVRSLLTTTSIFLCQRESTYVCERVQKGTAADYAVPI